MRMVMDRRRAARGVARRAQRGAGDFDFSQKHLVVSRGFAAAKSSGPGVTMCYAGARDGDMENLKSVFSKFFCAVG